MEEIERIQEELKNELSEKRYLHSIGTMKMAEQLSKKYGVDEHISALTGLAHDIGKELSNEEKIKYANENNIKIDEIEEKNIGLLHGKIGADITKKRYGFTEEMQKAIKYHTTANVEMDLLAKIIFIADKIEETRTYEDIEIARKLAFKDIDNCMLYILNFTIKNNIDKNKLIHPNSIYMRNKLLH